MRSVAAWLTLLLMIGAPRVGSRAQNASAPGAKDELSFIEQARHHALAYTRELPNFVVSQKVTRGMQTALNKGKWQTIDILELELTYELDKAELIKLVKVDGKPATKSYNELGGMTSLGEFGSSLAGIFWPQSETIFKEVRHDSLRGRDAVIYDFRVKKSNSKMTIRDRNSGQSITVGYSGRLWIDSETKQVLRIESSADDIPPTLVITLQESAIDYDWVKIEDAKYLLPLRAELLIGVEAQKVYMRNVIEFVNYHKFEGKIKIVPNSN